MPAGWILTKLDTGKYRITHSLNLPDEKNLHIVATLFGGDANPTGWRIHTQGRTVDRFVIHIDDLSGNAIDDAFFFVAILTPG